MHNLAGWLCVWDDDNGDADDYPANSSIVG